MARLGMLGAVLVGIMAGLVLSGLGGANTAAVRSQEPSLADRVRQLEDRMAAVEARLAALDGMGASSAPSAPSAAPATVSLLDVRGTDSSRTSTFVAPGSRVQLCWEITDAQGAVSMAVDIQAGTSVAGPTIHSQNVNRAGTDCTTVNVEAGGTYFVFVHVYSASAPLRWRVTVQPA